MCVVHAELRGVRACFAIRSRRPVTRNRDYSLQAAQCLPYCLLADLLVFLSYPLLRSAQPSDSNRPHTLQM